MPTGNPADVDSSEIVRMYVDERMTYRAIAERIGFSRTVVRNRLREAGIGGRSRNERGRGPRPHMYRRAVLKCDNCGGEYTVQLHDAGGRRFCSPGCSAQWHARKRAAAIGQRPSLTPTLICLTCNQEFQPLYPYEAKARKYCSRPCMLYARHQNRQSPEWFERSRRLLRPYWSEWA